MLRPAMVTDRESEKQSTGESVVVCFSDSLSVTRAKRGPDSWICLDAATVIAIRVNLRESV